MLMILTTSLGCSLGQMLFGAPTPTPTVTPVPPLPTWTPSPVGALSPADAATQTVLAGLAIEFPTLTATPTPYYTPTPTATFTPLPTPVDTPTPTPAASLLVTAPAVNVRSGPSVAYPVIGQVSRNETYTLIGRNEAGTWWQICCVNGQQGWITAQLTAASGPVDTVPVVAPPDLPPAPPPVAVAPPTATPYPTFTPAPFRPVKLSEGPEMWETNNPWLTIWLKVYVGQIQFPIPISNLRMRVLRNGVDVSQNKLTADSFQFSAPTANGKPLGNRREYNLKYEYLPNAGNADWTILITDANGAPLSELVTFQTTGGQEVYVSFYDTR